MMFCDLSDYVRPALAADAELWKGVLWNVHILYTIIYKLLP